MKLKDYIEEIPDFPVKGILFKDISPLIANYQAMSYVKASFLDIIMGLKKQYNILQTAKDKEKITQLGVINKNNPSIKYPKDCTAIK